LELRPCNLRWRLYKLTLKGKAIFLSVDSFAAFFVQRFFSTCSGKVLSKLLFQMAQFVRSRVNLQELSRRFVSGKKLGFDFYIDEKIEELSFVKNMAEKEDHYQGFKIDAKKLIEISQEFYDHLLANGVKAEAARRFIPQAAYTELWAGFNNFQLDNFLELRLESHSQKEIRFLAEAMRDLWQENSTEEKRRVSRVVTQ
jgi:thymidylate synthase ThyX